MIEWLVFLLSISATAPIRVALRVDISKVPTFEAILYIYGFRVQIDGRVDRWRSLTLRRNGGKTELQTQLKWLTGFAAQLFRTAQWAQAEIHGRVGTGDACSTALASACLSEALKAVSASVGAKVRVDPEFSCPFFALKASCILSFRGGDIILAGIRAFAGSLPTKKKAGSADGTASH